MSGERLLLVEGETAYAEWCRDELQIEGYQVRVAHTAREAVRAIATEVPEVLVMDLCLPDANGLDTLRKVVGRWPGIPVVIHTAFAYGDDFSTWLADDYVVKSSNLTALLEAIRRTTGRSSRSRGKSLAGDVLEQDLAA